MSKPAKKVKAAAKRTPTSPEASAAAKALAVLRANDQPSEKPKKPSKQSRMIEMLRSPKGATIDAMIGATGWQQHSVRGFLAGVVRKRLKLKLDSRLVDGKRIYRVVDGSGAKPDRSRTKTR